MPPYPPIIACMHTNVRVLRAHVRPHTLQQCPTNFFPPPLPHQYEILRMQIYTDGETSHDMHGRHLTNNIRKIQCMYQSNEFIKFDLHHDSYIHVQVANADMRTRLYICMHTAPTIFCLDWTYVDCSIPCMNSTLLGSSPRMFAPRVTTVGNNKHKNQVIKL